MLLILQKVLEKIRNNIQTTLQAPAPQCFACFEHDERRTQLDVRGGCPPGVIGAHFGSLEPALHLTHPDAPGVTCA